MYGRRERNKGFLGILTHVHTYLIITVLLIIVKHRIVTVSFQPSMSEVQDWVINTNYRHSRETDERYQTHNMLTVQPWPVGRGAEGGSSPPYPSTSYPNSNEGAQESTRDLVT